VNLRRWFSLLWRIGVGVCVLIVIVAIVCFHFYVGPEIAKRTLEMVVSSGMGERAAVDRAVVHWLGRPRIEYQGFSVRKGGEEADWIRVDRIVLTPRLRSLFSRSIRWSKLELEHPVVRLSGAGAPSKMGPLGVTFFESGRTEVRDGHIQWPDMEVDELFFSFGDVLKIGSPRVTMHGVIKETGGAPAWFSLKGRVHPPPDEDFSRLGLTVDIEAKDFDPRWLEGYLGGSLPADLSGTRVSLTARFEGDLQGRFESSGTLDIRNCPLIEKRENLAFDYAVRSDRHALSLDRVRFKDPEIPFKGTGRVDWGDGDGPRIGFEVSCPWTSIERAGEVFSFFPEGVRTRLEGINEGEFKLVSLGFAGPIGAFRFPEDQAGLLRWRGNLRVRDGVFAWQGETLDISEGWVKLVEGRLVGEVSGVSMGRSRLDHAGFSVSQPFDDASVGLNLVGSVILDEVVPWMTAGLVHPGVAAFLDDLDDLSGQADVDLQLKTSLKGKSPQEVAGRLRFEGVGFRTPHLPGAFTGLRGSLGFLSGDVALKNLHGRWGRSTLRAEGSIRSIFSKRPEIECSLSGHLDLSDLTEFGSWEAMPEHLSSALQEIVSPRGGAGYTLAVEGRLGMPGGLAVKGDLNLQDAAFRLWNAYPMRGVNGRISFAGDRVSVSGLRGQWKNSRLGLDVEVAKTGQTDSRDLIFTADFDVADVASEPFGRGWPRRLKKILSPFQFRRGRAHVEAHNRKRGRQDTVEGHIHFDETTVRYLPVFPFLTSVEGLVTFDARSVKVLHLRGRYEESRVNLDGDLTPDSEKGPPLLSVRVDRIDCEKIFTWPWFEGVNHGKKKQPPVSVRVQVDDGVFRQMHLSDMKAELTIEGDQGVFERLTFGSNDGFGLITGVIGLERDGKISFDFRPRLTNVRASPILMSFQRAGSKRQLTGSGSAQGTLRGQGKGVEAIGRSLNGEVDLVLENGRLAQFSVVSKIFSLLDLTWVLRADIPDLTTEGMSYKMISGHVTVTDGEASTDNLLLESESMKISLVGSLHIPSGGLDLRLGIRRLGVGGKIMSKVPFFGEVVTKDGGSFINYYFGVKGTVVQPEVYGIPLESARDGILGPLQRLLEKPVDWFNFQQHPDFDRHLEDDEFRYP